MDELGELEKLRGEIERMKSVRQSLADSYENDRSAIFERLDQMEALQAKADLLQVKTEGLQSKTEGLQSKTDDLQIKTEGLQSSNTKIKAKIRHNRRLFAFIFICIAFAVCAGAMLWIDLSDNGKLDYSKEEFDTISSMAGAAVALSVWVASGKADGAIK